MRPEERLEKTMLWSKGAGCCWSAPISAASFLHDMPSRTRSSTTSRPSKQTRSSSIRSNNIIPRASPRRLASATVARAASRRARLRVIMAFVASGLLPGCCSPFSRGRQEYCRWHTHGTRPPKRTPTDSPVWCLNFSPSTQERCCCKTRYFIVGLRRQVQAYCIVHCKLYWVPARAALRLGSDAGKCTFGLLRPTYSGGRQVLSRK